MIPLGWTAQRITLTRRCSFPIAGSVPFKRGDTWHCLEHGKSDVKVIAIKDAAQDERIALCEVCDD